MAITPQDKAEFSDLIGSFSAGGVQRLAEQALQDPSIAGKHRQAIEGLIDRIRVARAANPDRPDGRLDEIL